MSSGDGESASLVEVAVPLPLPEALTYETPPALVGRLRRGMRVKVPVGARRVTGVVLATEDVEPPPSGSRLREVQQVLDLEPALSSDLLALARFAAEYYLAPIGEVLRTMLPANLPAPAVRLVRLTDAGALARPRDPRAAALLEALLERGPTELGDLLDDQDLDLDAALVDRLEEEGWLAPSRRRGGRRYGTVVDLVPGEVEDLEERCGRSAKGRAVVRFLAAAGRPCSLDELVAAVECGPGVVRRLVGLGILRRAVAPERAGFDRHMTAGRGAPAFRLRPDQAEAVAALRRGLDASDYEPFLLSGVTGSGKTEVYVRAIAHALAQDRGAIVMVPEIALVPALARELVERFGERVAMLHSNLSSKERGEAWYRVRRGEARVVVGPRSALFAPVRSLGLVVVDEEHDAAYKQETTPRYHGRDLALVRARSAGAVAVVASATPSFETRRNVQRGRMRELRLVERAGSAGAPEILLVDLRREPFRHRPGEIHFSDLLERELRATLERGEQAILLRNRRGYAPVLLCRACGEDLECEDCGLPRTMHRRDRRMQCHYCGSTVPIPRVCVACGEAALEPIGAGTERVEETFRSRFPGVAVDVLDRDATQRVGGAAAVLEKFRRGGTQVLVGTQMIAKGHHFPRVTLTAVLSADSYLGFPDFRAVERTYNLLTQVAGRAGREDRPGRVVIQTHHPDHYAIEAVLAADEERFVSEEMRFRRIFHYPPFSRLASILVRDRDRRRAEARVAEIARALERCREPSTRVAGPAPAPFERLRGRWRFQILVRTASSKALHRALETVPGGDGTTEVTIDVDPQDLL